MSGRRIVMFNQVSADGFFSDPDGGLDWVVSDPEIQARAVAGMPNTDTILFGRRTYEQFASFWPSALEDLDRSGPHGERKREPAFAAMARWLNATKKLVFSTTLQRASWHNTEVLATLDAQQVAKWKQQPGKDFLLFGSGSIVSQLTEQRLIDEYRLVVCPILLGEGSTLLGNMQQPLGLKLLEAKPFRSGNVMLTYQLNDER